MSIWGTAAEEPGETVENPRSVKEEMIMGIDEALEKLMSLAESDAALRQRLLATKDSDRGMSDFCSIATEVGCPMNVMDLIEHGESAYAAMKRSTNGGGENSPLLDGQDDDYLLFLAKLERMS